MATQIEAARQMVLHAAQLKEEGRPCLTEASMAKLFASEMAEKVCSTRSRSTAAMATWPTIRSSASIGDVRICQIYEGTSDVQRIVIARNL